MCFCHVQEAIEFLKASGNIKQALVIEKQLGIASTADGNERQLSTRSSDGSSTPLVARPSHNGLSAGSAQLLEHALQLLEVHASPNIDMPQSGPACSDPPVLHQCCPMRAPMQTSTCTYAEAQSKSSLSAFA